MQAFAYTLDILAFILLLAFFVANHPRPPETAALVRRLRSWRRKELDELDDLQEQQGQDKLSVRLFSIQTLYYLVFLGCAFAGTFYSLSLIWVSILGIVIMYLYAVVAFAKFRSGFRPDESLMFCGNLYQCFITVLRFGLIGDLF
uniref:MAPEG family protein n=1 Tax=Macrostomum lignano TaxID=282301 RepID=A0A1I8JKH0_9PLAT